MDNLQTLWHKAQLPGDELALGVEQISRVIHQKSRSEFDKFRRTLFWEILFNGAFTIVCGVYVMMSTLREFPAIMITTFLIIGGFLAWQYYFYQRLCRHSIDTDVYCHLKSGLALLKKFVLHYKIVYGILLPISGILGFALGFMAEKEGTEVPLYELPQNPWLAILFVVSVLGLAFTMIHFQFKYLYQPKINRMQRMLEELRQPT